MNDVNPSLGYRRDKMAERLLQSMSRVAGRCNPDCVKANNEQEDYDASQSAALVAVNLISSARFMLKLDTEFTEYSAQFLMDNAGKEDDPGEMDQQRCQVTTENCLRYLAEHVWTKREDRQRDMDQQRCELTVKDCLELAFKKGLPRREHWAHLGCTFKAPPFACQIPRVPVKGEVVEAKTYDEAFKLLMHQPVGAKLHLFSPQIDRVGEGIYDGPATGNETCYVGLRDVLIASVEEFEGDTVAIVKICYKKKLSFIKVSLTRMFLSAPHNGDESKFIGPTGLLVDFIVPRLSIN
ncbi:protein HEAT-INDUCED TAS1 TARGET 4 isoform X1 [Arabidopsis lyrata subsp. lyrata]|nr:protein HEAT-INDUCED TAS1 TARGET 4 isoform X1 [Arabidopsis lyrata subsp. lyrata]|eukprot:XP_020874320.1 protein HEAT-INDUCED TAS1 TARGET 4 isoform X1 [Arabidopsis lyrata subsp. lyrata]